MQNLLTGQAGVWRVASQLALRGLHPHFPGVDYGYDLLIDGGLRIQVKAVHLRTHQRVYPQGAYWFKLWQSNVLQGSNKIKKRGGRDYSKCADFIVLWGIDEDRFWIVPAITLAKTQCVVLGPEGFHKRQDFARAHELHDLGHSQADIAAQLGVTQAAISYQLRGGRKKQPKRTMTAIVREHENRWDLISSAVASLHEAQAVVAHPKIEIDWDVKVEQET